jgi:hypothetical protein
MDRYRTADDSLAARPRHRRLILPDRIPTLGMMFASGIRRRSLVEGPWDRRRKSFSRRVSTQHRMEIGTGIKFNIRHRA